MSSGFYGLALCERLAVRFFSVEPVVSSNPPMNLNNPTDLCGTILDGPVVITSLIGEGGMGTIYRARQSDLARDVCVKFLHAHLATNADALTRFRREGKVLSKLRNAHIVQVYSVGVYQNLYPYIIMELLPECITLRNLINQQGPLGAQRSCQLVTQICDGLSAVHTAGFVHRDLKPDNVLIIQSEAGELAKIIDFGISGYTDHRSTATQTGEVIGSLFYMSPESFTNSQRDPVVDVYATGCLLYECLTGAPPFVADTFAAVAYKHANETVPALPSSLAAPGTIEYLNAVIARCCEKSPGERFQSMEQLSHYLKDLAETGSAVDAPLEALRQKAGKKSVTGRWNVAWLCLLIGCAIAVLLGCSLNSRRGNLLRWQVQARIRALANDSQALLADANETFTKREYQVCSQILRQLLSSNTSNQISTCDRLNAWLTLCECQLHLGDIDQAGKDLTVVLHEIAAALQSLPPGPRRPDSTVSAQASSTLPAPATTVETMAGAGNIAIAGSSTVSKTMTLAPADRTTSIQQGTAAISQSQLTALLKRVIEVFHCKVGIGSLSPMGIRFCANLPGTQIPTQIAALQRCLTILGHSTAGSPLPQQTQSTTGGLLVQELAFVTAELQWENRQYLECLRNIASITPGSASEVNEAVNAWSRLNKSPGLEAESPSTRVQRVFQWTCLERAQILQKAVTASKSKAGSTYAARQIWYIKILRSTDRDKTPDGYFTSLLHLEMDRQLDDDLKPSFWEVVQYKRSLRRRFRDLPVEWFRVDHALSVLAYRLMLAQGLDRAWQQFSPAAGNPDYDLRRLITGEAERIRVLSNAGKTEEAASAMFSLLESNSWKRVFNEPLLVPHKYNADGDEAIQSTIEGMLANLFGPAHATTRRRMLVHWHSVAKKYICAKNGAAHYAGWLSATTKFDPLLLPLDEDDFIVKLCKLPEIGLQEKRLVAFTTGNFLLPRSASHAGRAMNACTKSLIEDQKSASPQLPATQLINDPHYLANAGVIKEAEQLSDALDGSIRRSGDPQQVFFQGIWGFQCAVATHNKAMIERSHNEMIEALKRLNAKADEKACAAILQRLDQDDRAGAIKLLTEQTQPILNRVQKNTESRKRFADIAAICVEIIWRDYQLNRLHAAGTADTRLAWIAMHLMMSKDAGIKYWQQVPF